MHLLLLPLLLPAADARATETSASAGKRDGDSCSVKEQSRAARSTAPAATASAPRMFAPVMGGGCDGGVAWDRACERCGHALAWTQVAVSCLLGRWLVARLGSPEGSDGFAPSDLISSVLVIGWMDGSSRVKRVTVSRCRIENEGLEKSTAPEPVLPRRGSSSILWSHALPKRR
ncbi:hypothetical protein EJ03DRAFT_197078 [Teratosphaeria nubilosa]|uniref:Uncharacterized protein n=1 Tax=Teratosphaeria nubilosa TaxID=161662 RepID=A0A6G1KYK6_9PEZI|nr:hypothetical protein EJ03DRAFT_197078 [Teratosphaeria nubilosa]